MSTDKYLTPKSSPAFYYSCTQKNGTTIVSLLCEYNKKFWQFLAHISQFINSVQTEMYLHCGYVPEAPNTDILYLIQNTYLNYFKNKTQNICKAFQILHKTGYNMTQ